MTTYPAVRALHDVGLATWAGGALMGAVGLNGAAAALPDPVERSRASTAGWSRWAPVGATGVAAHLIGATGLLVTDWPRVRSQHGVALSSAVKAGVTVAGVGVATWSAVLNRKIAAVGPVPVTGATEPGPGTAPDAAKVLRQLKLVQWLNPLVGFAILGVGSWQSEQQRAAQEVPGRLKQMVGGAGSPAALGAAGAALALGSGLLAARRRRQPGLVEVEVVEVDVITLDPARGVTNVTSVDPAAPDLL